MLILPPVIKTINMEINDEFKEILEKTRELSNRYSIRSMTIERVCARLGIGEEVLKKYVSNKAELIEKALEFERENFNVIFEKHNFEGVNAIDILATVSREMSMNFKNISPSLTFELKKFYPTIYRRHFEDRVNFIFGKIKINIEKGINQGMYRPDLSVELIARLYISRLIDLHNPRFFPPEQFSFEMLFDVMFDNFVRSIATPEGMEYYESRKQAFNFNVGEK